jgi:membrane fusion protein (multidrug efflux system)
VNTNSITIPQRSITRGAAGTSTVLVVGSDNMVDLRTIEIERSIGSKVVVSKGLKAGERIIVEGSQKAPPGSVVKPVPFIPPAGPVGHAQAK